MLDESNNLVTDPRRISHKFNHYFSTIGQDIERKIPTIQGSFKYYFNKKNANGKLLINPLNSSFFLSPTVPREVERVINGLDDGKTIYSRIYSCLIKYNLIFDKQFGFRVLLNASGNLLIQIVMYVDYLLLIQ